MKRFNGLIEFDDAVRIIREKMIIPEKNEEVNLQDSVGRILMEPLFSNRNLPEFSRSRVDGFAFNSARTSPFFMVPLDIAVSDSWER